MPLPRSDRWNSRAPCRPGVRRAARPAAQRHDRRRRGAAEVQLARLRRPRTPVRAMARLASGACSSDRRNHRAGADAPGRRRHLRGALPRRAGSPSGASPNARRDGGRAPPSTPRSPTPSNAHRYRRQRRVSRRQRALLRAAWLALVPNASPGTRRRELYADHLQHIRPDVGNAPGCFDRAARPTRITGRASPRATAKLPPRRCTAPRSRQAVRRLYRSDGLRRLTDVRPAGARSHETARGSSARLLEHAVRAPGMASLRTARDEPRASRGGRRGVRGIRLRDTVLRLSATTRVLGPLAHWFSVSAVAWRSLSLAVRAGAQPLGVRTRRSAAAQESVATAIADGRTDPRSSRPRRHRRRRGLRWTPSVAIRSAGTRCSRRLRTLPASTASRPSSTRWCSRVAGQYAGAGRRLGVPAPPR